MTGSGATPSPLYKRGAVDQHARAARRLRRLACSQRIAAGAVAVLEQQQAERGRGVDMALARRLLEIIAARAAEVDRHALAQAIGLAEVEGGVGIALVGQRAPDRDRGGVIALLPRLDPGAHALRRGGAPATSSADAKQIADCIIRSTPIATRRADCAKPRGPQQGRADINQYLEAWPSLGSAHRPSFWARGIECAFWQWHRRRAGRVKRPCPAIWRCRRSWRGPAPSA